MKKFILLAGLAAMLAASPAFATVKHVAKPAVKMCTVVVHGKHVKKPCKHKVVKKHAMAAKVAPKKK